jgi:hypothetical protein
LATDDAVVIGLGSTTGAGMFATVTVTTQADWASLLLSLRFKLLPRQPPQHWSDHRNLDQSFAGLCHPLVVLGHPAVLTYLGEGLSHDPTLWYDVEARGFFVAPDDLKVPVTFVVTPFGERGAAVGSVAEP